MGIGSLAAHRAPAFTGGWLSDVMQVYSLAPSRQIIRTGALRGASLAPGFLIFSLALLAPGLRRPDGSLLPLAWGLAVGGLSLTLVGAAWRTRWQRSAGLLALALVGQASALGLVHAPNYGVIQHYPSWQELSTSPAGLLLLVPLAQTGLALATARRWLPVLAARSRCLLPMPRLLVLVCVLAFGATSFSRDVARYAGELALSGWILTANGVNLAFVASAVPADALERAATWLRVRFRSDAAESAAVPRWEALFPWAIALVVTTVAATLAWTVFERVPHIPDSVGYLFQAKHFSTGQLYLPAPPDAAAFEFEKLHNDGARWWNYGFPGWPAILSLGVLAGAPWLVNPLLGGLTVLLAHALLARLYGRASAHAMVLLLAVSPWLLFMSAGFEAHPLSVVWLLVALLAVERERDSGRGRWAAVAGASLGALLLTRPLEAMLLAPLVGIWSLGVGGRRLTAGALASLSLVSLVVGSLVFPYSYALTGRATYFPHQKWADERWYPGADRLGFGLDVGNLGWTHLDPLPGHGPVDVIVNANQNLYMAGFELFGWSFGSLGFVLLALLCGRVRRPDGLFIAIALAIVAGHSLYWFSGGPDIGARYWYQIVVPLVVLTVRGIQELQRRWLEAGGTTVGGARVLAFVVAASLVALVNFLPWRSLGKYYHYRDMGRDMAYLAEACQFGNSLVFVQEGTTYGYSAAFVFNPPSLDSSGTIYARDVGPAGRATLAQHFPDRPVWVVAGSLIPGEGFRVVDAPAPSSTPSCLDRSVTAAARTSMFPGTGPLPAKADNGTAAP